VRVLFRRGVVTATSRVQSPGRGEGEGVSPRVPAELIVSLPGSWDPGLPIAASRAGATGLLDLTWLRDERLARAAIERLTRLGGPSVGAVLGAIDDAVLRAAAEALPDDATVLLSLEPGVDPRPVLDRLRARPRRAGVVARSEADLDRAESLGVDFVAAKGVEAGGVVGDETTFVLLQRLVRRATLPVLAWGGVGWHTAAACRAGGAAGIVLDWQLALLRESPLSPAMRSRVERFDGSETALVRGPGGRHVRLFARPGFKAREEIERILDEHRDQPERAAAALRERAPALLEARGPEDRLWLIGQDAAFAASFAREGTSVGRILPALRARAAAALAAASRSRALDASSPLARSHGTEYPIVQGPMTRVSDVPAFIDAVERGGALPVLALALMREPQVRTLLAATRARLAGRPFGVGILGFVPRELREEQLRAILEAPPPFAIIAGGRPDQAAALEARGIATSLHVPSPGMLETFLRDGARRFVFEGSECGGHIGPRTSFILWETMVRVLCEADLPRAEAEKVHVLFGGGIHDARSGAMVAALAEPLHARGMKIGVDVGTAYLFTEEAVATGAIVPAFQAVAMEAERTILVETGPGHAIRCAPTEFFSAFEAEKDRLKRAGVPGEEIREQLEGLNMGRLRIASKGIVRQGDPGAADPFRRVDETEQRREGMYMLGQVAALHRERTTIRALHERIGRGSADLLAEMAARPEILPAEERPSGPPPLDIAVVGIACLLPGGAHDAATFWENIVQAKDAIGEIPPHRFDASLWFDADRKRRDHIYSKWGGFLEDLPFDPLKYGIPPAALKSIEPLQLLALEMVDQALRDAGYDRHNPHKARTSVILGVGGGAAELGGRYAFRSMLPRFFKRIPEEFLAALPEWTEDSFPGILLNVVAGRIANRFDLGGVNFTVDAACASSLAAIYLAGRELATGACDMAIAGGCDTVQNPFGYLCFSKTGALSPRGRSRTFDASADGIAISEGHAAIVLKRRADAERDGDRIYAVLRAAAGGSDGRVMGLTAPHEAGQVRTLERAYAQAGFSPATVGLFEAHGTGTVVGDQTECRALASLLDAEGAAPQSVAIGSVKSMIGHTKCTAGVAGLIKTALALHHRLLPPTLHVETPNPKAGFPGGPLYVSSELRPWLRGAHPRRAGVSAFGFGGSNFHAVLEEYDGEARGAARRDATRRGRSAELFLLAGGSAREVAARARALAREAAQPAAGPRTLADVACARHARDPRPAGAVRAAVVASDLDTLAARLERLAARLEGPGAQPGGTDAGDLRAHGIFFSGGSADSSGPVACLLAGPVDVVADSFRDLAIELGEVAEAFEAAASGIPGIPAAEVLKALFPPPWLDADSKRAAAERLASAPVAGAAAAAAGAGMTSLLSAFGLEPAAVATAPDGAALVAMHDRGIRVFVDASPHGTLRRDVSAALVSLQADSADGWLPFLAALGDLWAIGAPLDPQRLYDGEARALDPAPRRAPAPGRSSHVFMLNGTSLRPASQPAVVEGPRFSLGVGDAPAPSAGAAELRAAEAPRRVAADVPAAAAPANPYAQFQATMRAFLDTQERVMRSFLDDAGLPRPAARARESAAIHAATTAPSADIPLAKPAVPAPAAPVASAAPIAPGPPPAVTAPAATRAAATAATAPDASRLREDLLRIVSERTGYPAEMLADDANLEADLGIDSIKRVEIIAAFRRTVLPSMVEPPADYMERMTAARTLRAILAGTATLFTGAGADAPGPAAIAATTAPRRDPAEMARQLREIIAERTGYPVEMLADEAHLEADLGIDSIKRVEIIAAFRRTVLPDLQDLPGEYMERMAAARTAAAIVREMASLVDGGATSPQAPVSKAHPAAAAAPATAPVGAASAEVPRDEDCPRSVPRLVELPGAGTEAAPLRPGCVLLTDDGGGLAAAVARQLVAANRQVALLSEADLRDAESVRAAVDKARVHGSGIAALLHLAPLADAPVFPGIDPRTWGRRQEIELRALLFLLQALQPELKEADGAPLRILAASRGGGDFSASADEAAQPWRGGLAGMLKVAAREFERGWFRAVDFDRAPDAEGLLAELAAPGPVEVGRRSGARLGLEVAAAPLHDAAPDAPAGQVASPLGPRDVVLVTGGARGITAEVAVEIAARTGATMVLLGRTPPPPAVEPEATAAHTAPADLRKALLEGARRLGAPVTPKEIEARLKQILADRDIRATLEACGRTGASAEYVPCDVRHPADLERVIRAVVARHGRIDAVVHGAGVIEDRLIADKSAESFDRVVATKTAPLLTLARLLDPGSLKLLLLFSSTSGFFGNTGQVDYAAANEILNRMARRLKSLWPARVVAINWGPWSGAGMVTPEVARQFRARGVGMVTVPAGRAAAWREIARHDGPVRVLVGPGAWNRPAPDAAARIDATPAGATTRVDLEAAEALRVVSAAAPATPLLERQSVVRSDDGGVEARVLLDPARHPYLDHHRIDGKAVLPLAVAMELMTETAAAAAPSGWHVTHVLDLRMFSGVLIENGAREIAVTAARENGHGAEGTWRVRIADPKVPARKLYEATVRLSAARPDPPAAPPLPAIAAPCGVSVTEAYDRWTFHGPALQVIEELRRVDVRGVDAVVRPSSPRTIAGASSPGWLIDAAMLDAGPQIATIWSRYHQDVTVLPNRIACYHRYGPLAGPPAEVAFRVSTGLDGQTYKGDVWYLRDGRVLGRIEGLEGSGTLELNRITLKPPR
jgi:acyl transferase domain-containing protein/NAD(P)H-dependent flavin oxidoreductase YrpB (nitropropane dioxygenase family)